MMLREREDGGYAGDPCQWCDGDGFMTVEQLERWKGRGKDEEVGQ